MEDRGFVISTASAPTSIPGLCRSSCSAMLSVWLSETEPRYLYQPPIEAAA